MGTFNWIVFLWQVTFVISVLLFFYGLYKKSWVSLFFSFVTFLPIAYYFIGTENGWRIAGFVPVLLLVLTVNFWRTQRKAKSNVQG
ncbi:phosphoglycerol transferase MdoB-like AlkP superfamily enzyme [Peribacillus cavernae]|nr:phosphoglycerol transferase MdoB-like AlkP superfamily enzyme [Peribacillus cavernae]